MKYHFVAAAAALVLTSIPSFALTPSPEGACEFAVTFPQPPKPVALAANSISHEAVIELGRLMDAECSVMDAKALRTQDILDVYSDVLKRSGYAQIQRSYKLTAEGGAFTFSGTLVRQNDSLVEHMRCLRGDTTMMCQTAVVLGGRPVPAEVERFFASVRPVSRSQFAPPTTQLRTWSAVDARHWFDISSVQWEGEVRGWILENLDKPGKAGAQSVKTLLQGDCEHWQLRLLAQRSFEDYDAGGRIVDSSDQVSRWIYAPDGSSTSKLLQKLCLGASVVKAQAQAAAKAVAESR